MKLTLVGINVCVDSDCELLNDAEMIHNTGKTEKKIRSKAMINLTITLNRFWNFCDERRFS